MNTKVEIIGNCRREIQVEVSKDAVSNEFDRVFDEIQKRADIKGFRKGKAPLNLVRQQFAQLAKEEVIKALIPEYYRKAVEKENFAVASYPEISEVHLEDSKLSFKATFDIKPDVTLKNYKGIKVNIPKLEVQESEVEKTLESIRKNYAESLKQQEEQRNELPKLDDDFAKKIGLKDLADLKSKIKEQLLIQSKTRVTQDQQRQLVKHLLSGVKFEIPGSWVKNQSAHLLNTTKVNLLMSGVKREELDAKIKEKESEIEKQAQDNVRLFFILDKIAEKENIKISEKELERHVETMASRQGVTGEQMREYLSERNLWEDLIVDIRQQKVMDFLIKESKED